MNNPLDLTTCDFMTITPGNPAAGANMSFLVPVKAVIMPLCVAFTLAADANAGTRQLQLAFNDGTSNFAVHPAPGTQIATQTFDYSSSVGAESFDHQLSNSRLFMTLPADHLLRFGDSIVTIITGIKATDQISNIVIRYRQWIVD